jgi:hypothetical protein
VVQAGGLVNYDIKTILKLSTDEMYALARLEERGLDERLRERLASLDSTEQWRCRGHIVAIMLARVLCDEVAHPSDAGGLEELAILIGEASLDLARRALEGIDPSMLVPKAKKAADA